MLKKKGAEITSQDAAAFQRLAMQEITKNAAPAFEKTLDGLKKAGIEVVAQKIRDKTFDSLHKKMNDRWSNKTLDQVTDGIGMRIVCKAQKDVNTALAKWERLSGMKILEHEDTTEKGKNGGYRAQQLLVRTPGGMVAELQIKTENQQKWSKWSHDDVYKAKPDSPLRGTDGKLKPEVVEYANAVSDHLAQQDRGETPPKRPEAPEIIKKQGLEYKFD